METIVTEIVTDHVSAEDARIEAAVELAATWLATARSGRAEARRRARLGNVVTDDQALALSVGLADAVLRIPQPARSARMFVSLVRRTGIPASMSLVDRINLRLACALAVRLPRLVMPLVRRRVRRESAGVILPAESGPLGEHLARRTREGFGVNVNVLGEAILGEREAARRLAAVMSMLARPDVSYVSVKVSAVVTQLDPMAFDDSVDRIVDRLRPLFQVASACSPAKFVNLDMEEYRDLELTMAAFMRLLDEPAFDGLHAGIVLQAYLPDAHDAFERLSAWAHDRWKRAGASIKVRIVKGANLAMETVEAETHGWQAAPYATKADVDASYKRLIDRAFRPDAMQAVRIGVASHNLFDVAWALLLATERGVLDRVEFEMLEGMAPGEADLVRRQVGSVRLYTPITSRDERTSATAYLVRRLDENTTRGNFLREAFDMKPGSPAFVEQADLFRAAVRHRLTVSTDTRRHAVAPLGDAFENEPDSDVVLAVTRGAIAHAIATQQAAPPAEIPVTVFGGTSPPELREWFDPSEPGRLLFRHAVVNTQLIDAAVDAAIAALPAWSGRGAVARAAVLRRCASVMADERFATIATMVLDCAKTVTEADPEVSEAIDFARYYAQSAETLATEVAEATGEPLGVVVVAPPWNFPYAIAAGGVLAALAAGNTVLLKPAPEAVRLGWVLARQLWAAGVPTDVLQFTPADDNEVGQRLITHADVAAVILTGAFATAHMFMSWKPDLHLLAETSGKNSLVVTAAADVDAAVRDLVRSAFGHSGQKCSAASLAIVEADVYDSDLFRRQLHDAVTSLRPGPAWLPTTGVAPVVRPPQGPLLRALTHLDAGESWLVEPAVDPANPNLWSPGVKLGVQPGSWSHRTEWFGPVLGVMRAPDVATALAWQNGTEYGLTAGIHSLDPDECASFARTAQAGNLYINRHITGAIVRRQPFGGWKRSAIGPGAKAGGPNYVAALQRWTAPVDVSAAIASYTRWWQLHFSQAHDPSGLASEHNVFRYRPLPTGVLVRIGDGLDVESAISLARAASSVTGTPVRLSLSSASSSAPDATVESDEALVSRLDASCCDRLRLIGPASAAVRLAAVDAGIQVDDTPMVGDGRIELVHWLHEQSISITAHRYGTPTPPSQVIEL